MQFTRMKGYQIWGGVTLLLLSHPVLAQSKAPQEFLKADKVRLAYRGRLGDVIHKKSHAEQQITVTYTPLNRQVFIEATADSSWTNTVRQVEPNGNQKIEVHHLGKTESVTHDDKTETQKEPPATAQFLLTPLGQISNGVALPEPAASASPKAGKGKKAGTHKPTPIASISLTPEARKKILKRTIGHLITPLFPEKALAMGDTWAGSLPDSPYEDEEGLSFSYTAKLTALELRFGVPCAKVEYDVNGKSSEFTALLLRSLPPGTQIEGTATMTGKINIYYSLDRGINMEEESRLIIILTYKLRVPSPDGSAFAAVGVKGQVSINGTETTTQFPAVDPTLIPQ